MKNIITGPVSTILSAIAVFSLLTAPLAATAADYSSGGYGYDYSYPSSGSGGYGYDYSYPSSGSGGYGYDYSYPSSGSSSGGGGGGSSASSKKAKPATCNIKLSKSKVEYGGSVTITWKTNNSKKDGTTLSGFGKVPRNEEKPYHYSRTDKNLTKDKTYTLTVKGENGKTITCKATVKVKPKPEVDVCPNISGKQSSVPSGYELKGGKCVKETTPDPDPEPTPAPECSMSLSSYKVKYNGSVKVSWSTKNADSVTLNGDSVSASGSKTFSNLTEYSTYTIEASNDEGDVTCEKMVDVEEEVIVDAPSCDISLSKSVVAYNGSVTVSWETEDAVTVTLNGASVAKNGSKTFTNLKNDTTYTIKATNSEDTVTCVDEVEVEEEEENEAPECTLSLSRDEIEEGEDVTVYWSTENAETVKLNGTSVNKNSSKTFYNLEEDKEFKLEVWNEDDKKVTCTETVEVEAEEEEDEDEVWCSLSSSKRNVRAGDSVRIDWESENADEGHISNGIGTIDEDDLDEGYESVKIYRTTTFTGTFSNDDQDDDDRCSVTVYVDGGPVYVPPHTPYITLSAVPYTGLEMGPVGTAIYWSFLVLWCLIAAYLIAVKKVHYRIKNFLFGSNEPEETQVQTVDMNTLTAMVQQIVNGSAAKPVYRTSAPSVTVDATDEFVLSQIHRNN